MVVLSGCVSACAAAYLDSLTILAGTRMPRTHAANESIRQLPNTHSAPALKPTRRHQHTRALMQHSRTLSASSELGLVSGPGQVEVHIPLAELLKE
eukprot:6308411-Lingulodinium_polyedra.AAC.1